MVHIVVLKDRFDNIVGHNGVCLAGQYINSTLSLYTLSP